jgi:hypothetical protein
VFHCTNVRNAKARFAGQRLQASLMDELASYREHVKVGPTLRHLNGGDVAFEMPPLRQPLSQVIPRFAKEEQFHFAGWIGQRDEAAPVPVVDSDLYSGFDQPGAKLSLLLGTNPAEPLSA